MEETPEESETAEESHRSRRSSRVAQWEDSLQSISEDGSSDSHTARRLTCDGPPRGSFARSAQLESSIQSTSSHEHGIPPALVHDGLSFVESSRSWIPPSTPSKGIRQASCTHQASRHPSRPPSSGSKPSRSPQLSRSASVRLGISLEEQSVNSEARRRENRLARSDFSVRSPLSSNQPEELSESQRYTLGRHLLADVSSASERTGGSSPGRCRPFVGEISPSLYTAPVQLTQHEPSGHADAGLGGDFFTMDDSSDLPKQLVRSSLMPVRRIVSFLLGLASTSWPVAVLGAPPSIGRHIPRSAGPTHDALLRASGL